MNRLVLCILTFLLLGEGLSYAQLHQIQQLEDPVGAITFYETLKSDYITKDTKSFGLKGNVKSVRETITYQNASEPFQIMRYEFLNNTLHLYEYKINNRSYPDKKTTEYFYDRNSNRLVKLIQSDSSYTSSTKTGFFDKEGYKFQEIRMSMEFDSTRYDTLYYLWNHNRDTVNLMYSRVYEKPYNRSYFFKFNGMGQITTEYSSTDSLGRSYGRWLMIMFDSVHHLPIRIQQDRSINSTITYNPQKQITRFSYINFYIRSRININYSYDYIYNQKAELSQILHFAGSHQHPDSATDANKLKYEIHYLAYDDFGNWTSKKITTGSTNEEYIYRREISYY